MPLSKIDIVNDALRLIGSSELNSLDEGSADAGRVNAAWNVSMEYCISLYPWSFAMRRAVLAPIPGAVPGCPSVHAFPFPAGILRIVSITDEAGHSLHWWSEGGRIHCQRKSIVCKYVFREGDVSRWSPGFASVMSAYLAFNVCRAINQAEQQPMLEQIFRQRLDSARLNEHAHEPHPHDPAQHSTVLAARMDYEPCPATVSTPLDGPLYLPGGD